MKSRLLMLVILLVIAGCAGYKANRLKKLNPKLLAHHEQILFNAQVFTEADYNKYLGRDVIAAGFTPVQLTIKNQSDHYIEFTKEKMNAEVVPAYIAAESVYQSVTKRALGYGIPGFFMWPFLVPAIVDSIWALEANQNLMRDYLEKVIPDKSIAPESEIKGLIFVENCNVPRKLEVILLDRASDKKIVCKAYL